MLIKKIYTNYWWRWSIVLIITVITQSTSAQTFQEQVDSMLLQYDQAQDAKSQLALLNEIAYAYRRITPDSTLRYAELALRQAFSIQDTTAIAYAYKNKGIGLFKSGAEPDSIVFYYQKAIFFAEHANDHYTQAACLNNIGLTCIANREFNEAIQYFLRGVEIFDEHIKEESFLKALMLGNIGTAYTNDGDHSRGITYYERALAMAERLDNKVIPSIFVDQLAMAKMEAGDLVGAENDILSLMPLQDEIGDFESKAEALLIYSEIKVAKDEFEEARAQAWEAYLLAREREFTRIQTQSLVCLAQSFQGLRQIDSTIWYGQQAIELGTKSANYSLTVQALELMAKVQADNENWQEAYKYKLAQLEIQERSRSVSKQRIAEDLEAKYQNQLRLAEIERLNEEQVAQQYRIYGLMVVVSLVLLILVGMLYQYNQKVIVTKALFLKNEELKDAEASLSEKNQELQRYIQSNLQLENFVHLASHDLREPMRNIVSFSQLLQRSVGERLTIKEQEYLQFIVRGTERIDGLVKDLLAYSTVRNSPLNITEVDLSNLLVDIQNDLRSLIVETGAKIEIGDLPLYLTADRSRMYQLFQNLLTNAMRYHRIDCPPTITVSAEQFVDHHLFRVADNGIGIDPMYHEQVFMLFKSLDNKLVSNSSGIGLATAKRVVADHKGQIWVESNSPYGSVFCFTLAQELKVNEVS